jgi:hypothetical protein
MLRRLFLSLRSQHLCVTFSFFFLLSPPKLFSTAVRKIHTSVQLTRANLPSTMRQRFKQGIGRAQTIVLAT